MFYYFIVVECVHVRTVCVLVRYIVCYFSVVGSQDDPAAEAVAHIDDSSTAAEADDIWECSSQGHDQDLRTHAQYSRQWCSAGCVLIPETTCSCFTCTFLKLTLYFWKKLR